VAGQVTPGGNAQRSFLDTNVLVYADDPRDSAKQTVAMGIIAEHLRRRTGVVSVQVLQEYFVAATGKLRLSADLTKRRIEVFATLQVVESTAAGVLAAIDIHRLHQISFWDALILESAKRAGCRVLLSEDMRHGQTIDGVRVVNPFL